jgi:hypothetical protein
MLVGAPEGRDDQLFAIVFEIAQRRRAFLAALPAGCRE